MSQPIGVERWPDRIDAVLGEHCRTFQRAHVVRETGSTQDAARRMNAGPGEIIVAWNQTVGRGRLGRSWSSGLDGVAITFVLQPGQRERLAIAGAIGAARAAETMLGHPVGIKWPNDILVNARKLAGVLVEQDDRRALPAIGMNVSQTSWPDDLASQAVSLHQLGAMVDRIEVVETLIERMDEALEASDGDLIGSFLERDVLTGKTMKLRNGTEIVSGRLERLDPLKGLAVRTESGECWLPAATTTVLQVES